MRASMEPDAEHLSQKETTATAMAILVDIHWLSQADRSHVVRRGLSMIVPSERCPHIRKRRKPTLAARRVGQVPRGASPA
jgi:hypothetical protein